MKTEIRQATIRQTFSIHLADKPIAVKIQKKPSAITITLRAKSPSLNQGDGL
jgi:hypothetical protein